MKKYNYIAYDPMNCEYERLETLDEARKWLIDNQDFSEGIPAEYDDGCAFIAKITHVTSVKKTDSKKNYPCLKDPKQTALCSNCDEECKGTEEWPFDSEFDYVGEVVLTEVSEECQKS